MLGPILRGGAEGGWPLRQSGGRMTHSALYIATEAEDVSVGEVSGGDFFRFFGRSKIRSLVVPRVWIA